MAVAYYNPHFASLGLRAAQVLLAVLILGIGAGYLQKIGFNVDRASLCVATAVLSLLYVVPTFFAVTRRFYQPLVVLIAESLFFILYLASFGGITDLYGSGSCSGTFVSGFGFYSYNNDSCKLGKALIPFTLFQWLLFTATLVLAIFFTIVPLARAGGFNNLLKFDIFSLGAIHPVIVPSPATQDLEAGRAAGPGVVAVDDSVATDGHDHESEIEHKDVETPDEEIPNPVTAPVVDEVEPSPKV